MSWLDELDSERNTGRTKWSKESRKNGQSGFSRLHVFLNAIAEMARREGFEPPTLRFEEESEPEEPPTLTL